MTRSLLYRAALTGAVFVALTLLAAEVVRSRGITSDFYAPYIATRAVWSGVSPYTAEVAARVQEGYYGGSLPPGADEVRPAHLAHTYVLLGPFALPPPATATALWMGVQGAATLLALSLWLGRFSWKQGVLLVLALVAWRYSVSNFLVAQQDGVMLLLLALGARALMRERDRAAGVWLALATLHPTITPALALAVLGTLALRGRGRGLAAFVAVLAALTAVSIALVGWWLPDWLANVRAYGGYVQHMAWVPALFGPGVAVVALAALALAVARARSVDELYAAALICLLLLLPQTGSYHLLLLLPVVVVSVRDARALNRTRRLAVFALVAALFVLTWVYQPLPLETRKVEALLVPLHAAVIWLVAHPAAIAYRSQRRRGSDGLVGSARQ